MSRALAAIAWPSFFIACLAVPTIIKVATAESQATGIEGVVRLPAVDKRLAALESTPAIVDSLEAWEASGRTARLAPGEYIVTKPIELATGQVLEGSGPLTVLRADPSMHSTDNPPAIITNVRYAEVDEHQWRSQHTGCPMAVQVKHLTIHGGYKMSGRPYRDEAGKPTLLHGVMLNAPGSTVEGVIVYRMPGWGIHVKRWDEPRKGWPMVYDFVEHTVARCKVRCAYGGVYLGGADAIGHNLVCCSIRDTGLKTHAAANVSIYHGYGCGVGMHTVGRAYISNAQTENCTTGWINDGNQPVAVLWIAYKNKRQAVFNKPVRIVGEVLDGLDAGSRARVRD